MKTPFRHFIPPLSPEELDQLTTNILADGCREPLVVWGDKLVDGHNRLDICSRHKLPFKTLPMDFEDENAAKVWIIQNQFGRRNLAPYTRGELALQLEPLLRAKAKERQATGRSGKGEPLPPNSAEGETRDELAKIAGLGHDTIAKIKLIDQHADAETKKQLRKNQVSIHRVAKDIKDNIQKQERKQKRVEAAKEVAPDKRIIIGDFRNHSEAVADGSLSLIFTDPPYDREAEKIFPALANFAKLKLAEGGSLVMYLGHLQLPAAFDAFKGKLRHWWSCACVHTGEKALMREYGVRVGWKPMLWFVKGTRDDKSAIVCDTVSGGKEKAAHDWQQAENEAAHWIDALCPKDGIVCDPFLGGGTTAAAAQALKRKWIGFEIDAAQAAIAAKRVGQ